MVLGILFLHFIKCNIIIIRLQTQVFTTEVIEY
jgi:hypothetical protein